MLVRLKEGNDALFEESWVGGKRAGVTGVGHKPGHDVAGIGHQKNAGVLGRNVVVAKAVDEEDGYGGVADGVERGGSGEVQAITQAGVEEARGNDGTGEQADGKGVGAEILKDAVVRDGGERGKRRFGHDGLKAGFEGQRLEQDGSAHGFAQTVEIADWMGVEEIIGPLVDVGSFEDAVGGEKAAAGSMFAAIGREHRITVAQEQGDQTAHAEVGVTNSVKQDDVIGVARGREEERGVQNCAVSGFDLEVAGGICECERTA